MLGGMTTSSSARPRSGVTMFVDRRTQVTVRGSLDAAAAPDLERMAVHGLTDGTDVLVLDLSAVSDVDDAAIDALLRIRAAAAGGSVLLRVVPSAVARRALVSAGVADGFTLADQR
jgi:anti-anti-sigma regulatory factor